MQQNTKSVRTYKVFMWLFTISCIRLRSSFLPDPYSIIIILTVSSQHRPFLTSYFHPFAFRPSLLFTSPSETRNNPPRRRLRISCTSLTDEGKMNAVIHTGRQ